MKESPWGFDQPANLHTVWHRGTRSFNSMYARKIGIDGFEKSNVEAGFQFFPEGQMASMARAVSFLAAYVFALENPNMGVHYATYDLESEVPENHNNSPYVIKNGELVKK